MSDRTLVLHIALPGVNIDDWGDVVEFEFDYLDREPNAKEMADSYTTHAFREEVGVTLVTIPGEKCMNHEFDVLSFNGRIVGIETIGGDDE